MNKRPRLAIVGGGASGMAAALEAAHRVDVVLYEGHSRLGRKLLATGNGRCNFSHQGFTDANYHGTHPHFVHDALARYDEADTLAFFHGLGLESTVDNRARYYPASLQGAAVLDILRLSLAEAGVDVRCETRITAIHSTKDGRFSLVHKAGKDRADAVIIATGGEAAPKLGGTRDGYQLLGAFGHTLIETAPGIVQLNADISSLKAANGLKRDCEIAIQQENKTIVRDYGELLITNYGISGPPVLQCAGHAVRALAKGKKVQAVINFFPNKDYKHMLELFCDRLAAHPTRSAEAFFVGLLPRLLAQCALKAVGIKPQSTLDDKALERLANKLCAWRVNILGPRTFSDAQVTLGGIDTADFDPQTMASWMVPGLYACGEVLDIDGDCGGYNLQWAWSSGRLAGASAADYLLID